MGESDFLISELSLGVCLAQPFDKNFPNKNVAIDKRCLERTFLACLGFVIVRITHTVTYYL